MSAASGLDAGARRYAAWRQQRIGLHGARIAASPFPWIERFTYREL